ncbi:MAG: hypothetical protein JWO31_3344 [Phycisphaerales bacterium]|nr:hypothetical protein [Phycisphaerales bacterium]
MTGARGYDDVYEYAAADAAGALHGRLAAPGRAAWYDRDGFAQAPRTAWSTGAAGIGLFGITVLLLVGALGCQDTATSIIPNSDPALRKTRREFSADAMKRQPYHADAPKGGKINGAATVDYGDDIIQLANLTPDDWKEVEVWVNGQWVVYLPTVPGKAVTAKTIDFAMLYDQMARPFPSDNTTPEKMVNKVEIYMNGKMYELAGLTAE